MRRGGTSVIRGSKTSPCWSVSPSDVPTVILKYHNALYIQNKNNIFVFETIIYLRVMQNKNILSSPAAFLIHCLCTWRPLSSLQSCYDDSSVGLITLCGAKQMQEKHSFTLAAAPTQCLLTQITAGRGTCRLESWCMQKRLEQSCNFGVWFWKQEAPHKSRPAKCW